MINNFGKIYNLTLATNFFSIFYNELQTLQLWYQKRKKKMYTKTCPFCKKYPRETLIEHQTPSRKRERVNGSDGGQVWLCQRT